MGENTKISWTDATWNPAWGCTKIGPGCDNCYAEKLASRYGFEVWGPDKSRRTFGDKHWNEPVNWNKKARETGKRIKVFCASMCDVFENHPIIDGLRDRLWNLIRETQWLDWQLLTKRPNRIKGNLPSDWLGGYENVWLGTSVESGEFAWRADSIRDLPAVVKFISCEPAVGPLDNLHLDNINWVIYGGESGPNFRNHDINWARNLRIRCLEANVAFFYKQSPGRTPGTEAFLDGKEVKEFPVLRPHVIPTG